MAGFLGEGAISILDADRIGNIHVKKDGFVPLSTERMNSLTAFFYIAGGHENRIAFFAQLLRNLFAQSPVCTGY